MSMKLKVFGLGLLALMATSAFAVMNAGAEVNGHFVSGSPHTIIKGTESVNSEHHLHLTDLGLGGNKIGCTHAHYSGTVVGETVESVTITPTYTECYTTPTHEPGNTIEVTTNGCDFTFTVTRKNDGSLAEHSPAHLTCPAGKSIEIHHPNCTITITPQTVTKAVNYTTVTEQNKHAITLDVTAKFATEYHGGICIFLGTSGHEGELNGSTTVWGEDTLGNRVDITAT